jgi:hypothetical protein
MLHFTLFSPPSSRGLGRGPFKAKTGVRIPLGAQYGRGLNRLNLAVLSLLARLYANVPPPPPTLSTKERNIRAHQQNIERDNLIRQFRAEGKSLKELATYFGISIGRVHQIVQHK